MFEVELTLYAITDPISPGDLRAYWKANEAAEIDAAVRTAPSLKLGRTYVAEPGNEHERGPVGRVEDELHLIGTSTWPPERLPVIDEELTRALQAAFQSAKEDPPFEVAPIAELTSFLRRHLGAGLAYGSEVTAE